MTGNATPLVLVLSSEFPPGPGGIGAHAQAVASGLHEAGWRVSVLASQDHADDAEAAAFREAQPFEIDRWPSGGGLLRRGIRRWTSLRRMLERVEPDLVLATGSRAVWGASVAVGGRAPWVAVAHGAEFRMGGRLARLQSRRAFSRAAVVVCVSRFCSEWMVASGVQARRVEVIHNGADGEYFSPLGTESPNPAASAAGPVILSVGNLTRRKGQHVVLRALPLVLDKVPTAQFVAIGLPTNLAELQRLALDLEISDHVRFLGALGAEAVRAWYRGATVFAMTSTTSPDGDVEGFGIAVIEAALCGCPAVVSDSGGLPEAVDADATGLVVPESDTELTAKALVRLLTEPETRHRMASAAYERARKRFTWHRTVEEFDVCLRRVLGEGAGEL